MKSITFFLKDQSLLEKAAFFINLSAFETYCICFLWNLLSVSAGGGYLSHQLAHRGAR